MPLKHNVDAALAGVETPVKRGHRLPPRERHDIHIEEGRDVWWHREMEYVDANCPPVALDSEHPLFHPLHQRLDRQPKGILHTTGGYLLGAYASCKYVFDLRDEDIYWCAPTSAGSPATATSSMARWRWAPRRSCTSAPNWPDNGRFWKLIEEYAITIMYRADGDPRFHQMGRRVAAEA